MGEFGLGIFRAVTALAVGGLALPAASGFSASGGPVLHRSPDGLSVVERDEDGHFYVTARVNGAPVRFLIDTGATSVVLRREDATRAGVRPPPSAFAEATIGLGGEVMVAPVVLESVAVDRAEMRGVEASVDPGELDVSLLGQSYLTRLAGLEIRGDRLTLYHIALPGGGD